MYAGERMDESKKRSLIKFKANNDDYGKFDRIRHYYLSNEEYDQNYGIMMGASDGKDYYAIFGYSFTYGYMGYNFAKVDMQTGDTTVVRTFTDDERGRWYNNNEAVYDMAYDEHSKTLYALGYGFKEVGEETYGFTRLYAVDKETGAWELVTDFDCIYYEFCFDYDGNMYATRPKAAKDGETVEGTELVKLDSDFNEVSAKEIKSEWGESIVMYQFGAISMDNTTNTLYWIPATQNGATSMFTIDQEAGVCRSCKGFYPGN